MVHQVPQHSDTDRGRLDVMGQERTNRDADDQIECAFQAIFVGLPLQPMVVQFGEIVRQSLPCAREV